MIGFWIVLAICIALVFVSGMFFGKSRYAEHCYRNDATNWVRREFDNDKDDANMGVFLFSWIAGMAFCVLVGIQCDVVREYFIDKWRANEVVEQTTYHYKTINGEKILVDSTFQYVKNIDK